MIQITKEEAMAARAKFGDEVCISITSRHKRGGRKKYYIEETRRVLYFIERMRTSQLRRKNPQRGDR